ncbi:hypothetical protein B0H10DRAFT_1958486 [Mycena sp. CBHHK59/15]|nr:hypothetical protein B0H10DRAFT_1958486 [Mycena sp. CBHHK59/15]
MSREWAGYAYGSAAQLKYTRTSGQTNVSEGRVAGGSYRNQFVRTRFPGGRLELRLGWGKPCSPSTRKAIGSTQVLRISTAELVVRIDIDRQCTQRSDSLDSGKDVHIAEETRDYSRAVQNGAQPIVSLTDVRHGNLKKKKVKKIALTANDTRTYGGLERITIRQHREGCGRIRQAKGRESDEKLRTWQTMYRGGAVKQPEGRTNWVRVLMWSFESSGSLGSQIEPKVPAERRESAVNASLAEEEGEEMMANADECWTKQAGADECSTKQAGADGCSTKQAGADTKQLPCSGQRLSSTRRINGRPSRSPRPDFASAVSPPSRLSSAQPHSGPSHCAVCCTLDTSMCPASNPSSTFGHALGKRRTGLDGTSRCSVDEEQKASYSRSWGEGFLTSRIRVVEGDGSEDEDGGWYASGKKSG